MEDLFARLGQAGSRAATSTSPGTSPSAARSGSPGGCWGCATTAFAELGDTNLADLTVQGEAPHVRPRRLRAPTTTPAGRRDHCACAAASRCPASSTSRGARPARASPSPTPRATTRCRIPGNTMVANYDCIMPDGSAEQALRPCALRPRPARRRLRGRPRAAARDGQAPRLRLLRHRLEGDGDGGRPERRPDPQRPLALPDPHRPAAAGAPELPLPRPADDPPGRASRTQPRPSLGKIDTSALFYDGNSQGGIYGGTLTAVAPDFQRSVLGVPAMNYSTLLQRSTDFAQYGAVLYTSYPDEIERPLLFSLIQQLWDRSDPNGYAQHMTTDPLPEHAAAHGADAVGGRRPPGRQRRRRRRGAHDRREDPRPTRSTPAAATTCARSTRSAAPASRPPARSTSRGTRARASTRSRRTPNTPPVDSAGDQDPHGAPAPHRGGPGPEVRAPADRRDDHRPLRRRSLPASE